MTKLHIELSVIDRGENLVKRKRIYEALYPQTKRGTAGAMSRWGTDATAESAVASFNKDTPTKPHIKHSVSIDQ